MLKILVCANSYPPQHGGIATYASQLALHFSKLNINITVLAPHFPDQQEPEPIANYKIIRFTSKLDLYKKWLSEVVKTDLIFIVQRGNFLSLAFYTHKIIHKPYVLALHGREEQSKKLNKIITKINAASAVTPVSSYTANYFKQLGVTPSLIHVINNGTAPIKQNGPNIRKKYHLENKLIILTVARLIKHKGQDHLLKAFPLIKKEVPNAHYLIVGSGPDKDYLEDLAFQKLNLKENVTFTGAVSNEDIANCYHECDLFAMISRQYKNNIEGFGISFLEAGYAEKAVIGGNSGGIPDAIENNKTGILVDPNDLNNIASAVIELLQNKQKRDQYGKNGKKRVLNNFTWDIIAKRYALLFKDILNR